MAIVHPPSSSSTRRAFLRDGAVLGALGALGSAGLASCATAALPAGDAGTARPSATAGALKQSVCRWCYRDMPLEQLATAAAAMGLRSVELLDPEEFATVVRHGLVCAMTNAPGDARTRITRGFNRVENHAWLLPLYREHIARVAAAGFPNLICFSGNRGGLGDAEGLESCAAGLKALMPQAEQAGVTLCMELLNSRVNHPDYQCDHTDWGAALVARVGSPRFRLLYDIYHMQIMEGDVISTIRRHHQSIAHYHTAGVPGRHEIDDTQELQYPAIMRAIRDTGFTGYVAQEFVPVRAALESLADAVRRCTV